MADKVGTSSLPHEITTKVDDNYNSNHNPNLDDNGRPSLEQHSRQEKQRRDSSKSYKSNDAESTSHSSLGSTHSIHDDEIDIEQAPRPTLTHTKSRTSSIRSRAVTIIQRSKRRGLLGRYGLIPEVARPIEYARKTKWTITMIVALAAAAAPQGSAIFFPVLPQLSQQFGTTPAVTNLSVALYMASMAIFPLWWSSYSETLGRRTIYFVSFLLFTLASVLSAISTSIGMLIAMRVLGGGAAASVQAVGAGTIADLWEPYERGRAMGIFYLGPLLGPLFSPIIGGALGQKFGWRSTQWFLTVYGAIMVVLIVLFVPETLIKTHKSPTTANGRPPTSADSSLPEKETRSTTLTRVSTTQSIVQHSTRFAKIMYRFWIEPLEPLLYLRFPAVIIIVYYAAVTFGALYVLNVSLQATFTIAPYNFSTFAVGLLYIPSGLGYMIASPIGGKWCDVIMIREARRAGRFAPGTDGSRREDLILQPEDRMMENAYIGAVVYPAGLLLYGWAAEMGWHWMVPCVANFFFGLGSMIIFSVATTMLTEFMPRKATSGVAVNNLIRNIFACVGGIVGEPLVKVIGNGWLFTILGVWCMVSIVVVWLMRHYGPRWRADMQRKLEKME